MPICLKQRNKYLNESFLKINLCDGQIKVAFDLLYEPQILSDEKSFF